MNNLSDRERRLAELAGPCETSQAAALAPLIEQIKRRFGPRLVAVVYYGSCLRGGDPYDGLLDFYVIVDRYGPPGQKRMSGLGNRLIPPNVYYAQCQGESATLRCKYATLCLSQLEAGTSRWFQSSIWGRFAQPIAIVWARSAADRLRVRTACGQAVVALLDRALPALVPGQAAADTFANALRLSYATELRVESSSRSQSLVDSSRAEYDRRVLAARPLLAIQTWQTNAGTLEWPSTHPTRARWIWSLRGAWGRFLSIARLAKACFTFSNAIDYAAFKIERHTGQTIPVTDRLRRHPLIFGWVALWRVYRKRLLR